MSKLGDHRTCIIKHFVLYIISLLGKNIYIPTFLVYFLLLLKYCIALFFLFLKFIVSWSMFRIHSTNTRSVKLISCLIFQVLLCQMWFCGQQDQGKTFILHIDIWTLTLFLDVSYTYYLEIVKKLFRVDPCCLTRKKTLMI